MFSKTQTAVEIQRKLEDRTRSLNRHISAIRQEFAPLAAISGDGASPESRKPLSAAQRVGMAFATATAIGLLVGGEARKRKRRQAVRNEATKYMQIDRLFGELAKYSGTSKELEAVLNRVVGRASAAGQLEGVELTRKPHFIADVIRTVTVATLGLALRAGADWISDEVRASREI